MDGGRVTVAAPAKLTLSLRVTGVRSDGYHLIDAEMVSLSLHDVLTIDVAASAAADAARWASAQGSRIGRSDGTAIAPASVGLLAAAGSSSETPR